MEVPEPTPPTDPTPPPPVPVGDPPPPKSELQVFRENKAKAAAGESAPEPTPAPVVPVAEPEPVEAPEPPAAIDPKHLIEYDGEKYDMRTKAGKRISRLKGELKSSEQRIFDLQRQLAERPAPPSLAATPVSPIAADPNDHEPKLDDPAFADAADPYAAYLAAQSRWHARQEYKSLEAKRADADRTRQQSTEIAQAQDKWDAKLADVKQRHPDFDQAYDAFYAVLASIRAEDFAHATREQKDFKGGRAKFLTQHVLHSGNHDLAHYLGTHPDELQQLFKPGVTFEQHVRAVGNLEARVEASLKPAPKPAPSVIPPAPMAPVGGAASVTTYTPETSDLARFRQHYGVRGGQQVRRG